MLPKSILWMQSYCIWIERHEEAILLFCIFADVPNTLQIIVYRDKYHYSANLRCYSCVNSSGSRGGGCGGGANRTDSEKRLYFALLYLLSTAVCMYGNM